LIEGNDAELLSFGIDETDRRETNLIVDANVLFDYRVPPKSAFQNHLYVVRPVRGGI